MGDDGNPAKGKLGHVSWLNDAKGIAVVSLIDYLDLRKGLETADISLWKCYFNRLELA